jgi:hypothetical protein
MEPQFQCTVVYIHPQDYVVSLTPRRRLVLPRGLTGPALYGLWSIHPRGKPMLSPSSSVLTICPFAVQTHCASIRVDSSPSHYLTNPDALFQNCPSGSQYHNLSTPTQPSQRSSQPASKVLLLSTFLPLPLAFTFDALPTLDAILGNRTKIHSPCNMRPVFRILHNRRPPLFVHFYFLRHILR